MVSALLATNVAPTEWISDKVADQDSGAILANGTRFKQVTKILLAEKFLNVDFLVPVPKFKMNVSSELNAHINTLASLWESCSWQCHLHYST